MIQSISSPEQEKVAALFNKFGVEYLATGDFAMRKYVDSKYFNHMQLWVKPTPENFRKVNDAFASVRRKLEVDEKTFTTENADAPILKIGRGRKAVELYTSIPGVSAQDFNQTFANRKVLNAGAVPVPILNEKDLHKSLQNSSALNQASDLQLLERSMAKFTASSAPRHASISAIDWQEAARTMNPHRVLADLGFTHIPSKGLFGSSRSQTFERADEKITVYPNPGTRPIFIDHTTGKTGDAIDLLNWQHNYDRKEVNRYIKAHFHGLAPTQLTRAVVQGSTEPGTRKLDDQALAEWQGKVLKEQYGLKNTLNNPAYLQSRDLSLQTIFRPEFFKQVLNSLGWNSREQKPVNTENTAFPMRNDHGITTMIIRNAHFKGYPEGEKRDAVWLSNPPLSLNREIRIGEGSQQCVLPKGTEGTLIPLADKPGSYQFYFQDPNKKDQEFPYNKIEVSGKTLAGLSSALNPLMVNRLLVTENPIDAMSFHQLSPPKPGETRMYLSTGGQPSEKQIAYINQLVQRIAPGQVLMGNDQDKSGVKFNINLMGGIQHPAIPKQNQLLARLHETGANSSTDKKEAAKTGLVPEYHLKIFGAKDPREMETLGHQLTDAINRFTPKGQQPPARITLLNGSPSSGTELTIAFPKNDRFLGAAQQQLEKIINAGSREPVMKVVKPMSKDFTQDLADSKPQGTKINYDLGEVPAPLKTVAKNFLHQVSGYANSAFDALFGGVPGSLPRMEMPGAASAKPAQSDRPKHAVLSEPTGKKSLIRGGER